MMFQFEIRGVELEGVPSNTILLVPRRLFSTLAPMDPGETLDIYIARVAPEIARRCYKITNTKPAVVDTDWEPSDDQS